VIYQIGPDVTTRCVAIQVPHLTVALGVHWRDLGSQLLVTRADIPVTVPTRMPDCVRL